MILRPERHVSEHFEHLIYQVLFDVAQRNSSTTVV